MEIRNEPRYNEPPVSLGKVAGKYDIYFFFLFPIGVK